MSALRLLFVVVVSVLFGWLSAQAHETQPLIIDVTAVGDGYQIAWQAPYALSLNNAPHVLSSEACIARADTGPALRGSVQIDCLDGSPPQLTLIYALYPPAITTIIRHHAEGEITAMAVFGPGEQVFDLDT